MFKKPVWDDLSFVTWCIILLEVASEDGYTVVIKGWHGQQQYSGRLWHLNDAKLVLRRPKCAKKTSITPPPAAWTIETRQDGSMLSWSLCQILTLPSEWRSRNRDSSDQEAFLQSSIVQFRWSCVNCILRFLFLADRSGTRCGLLLLESICFRVWRVVCSEM